MDILVTEEIFNLLMIATTFSVILMAIIQKIKVLPFMKNDAHVLIADFLLSFLSIPFGMTFYNLNLVQGLWVSLFSFVGAPAIYQLLKSQNVINYTPKSLNDCRECIAIKKENLIKREDEVS